MQEEQKDLESTVFSGPVTYCINNTLDLCAMRSVI